MSSFYSDPTQLQRTSQRAARTLAWLAISGSLLVLQGWIWRLPKLASFGSGMVSLKANTALGLLAAATGVLLLTWPRARRWAYASFAFAGLVGALHLAQDLLNVDLRIDEALFREFPNPVQTVHPGRMSPLSAACLTLLGAAGCLVQRSGKAFLASQLLLGLALCTAVHTLFGYAWDVSAVFKLPGTTAMSMHMAFSTIVLALGAYFARPDRGVGRVLLGTQASSILTRRMLPLLIALPVVLGWVAVSGSRSNTFGPGLVIALISTFQMVLTIGVLAWTVRAMQANEAALDSAVQRTSADERVFRSTFENAFVGMAHVSGAGRWLRVNDALAEMLDYEHDAFLRIPVAELVDPADRGTLESNLRALREGRADACKLQLRWISRGGDTHWIDAQLSTVTDEADEFSFYVFVLQDVTRERQREEELRIRTRSIEAAGVGVVIADARERDLPVIYVNRAFEHMTGYPAAEIVGNNCRILNRAARDQPGLRDVREALATGGNCTVTLLNHRKDGEPLWIELSITPVEDSSGNITHFIGVQNDITERLRFSREREELLRDALLERGRAEEAARARDVLLAIVSHELRSPLNSIRLWSTLLKSAGGRDAALVEKALEHIDSNIDLQTRLVNDLLDVSRIASGMLELEREHVDIGELVGVVTEEFRPQARDAKVELVTEILAQPVAVDGDSLRLHQVVRNLVENALKFTPAGGSIHVTLAVADAEVEIRVRDTGCGLDAQQLEQVFEQFWQADGSSNRRFRGLGLGLNIVKHIVERHGGRVEVSSGGENQGSTFTLRLPIAKAADAQASEPQREPFADVLGETGDVLVVDDERTTAEALALALMARGLDVRVAFDVPGAREAIAERRPSVVISDLMMPGLTGFDFLRELRYEELREGLPPVRAIAISGRGNPSDRRRIRRAGFDHYMQKPIRVEALFNWIETTQQHADEAPLAERRRILVVGAASELASLALGGDMEIKSVLTSDQVVPVTQSWRPDVVMVDIARFPERAAFMPKLRLDHADLLIVGWTSDGREDIDDDEFDFVLSAPLEPLELARILRMTSGPNPGALASRRGESRARD